MESKFKTMLTHYQQGVASETEKQVIASFIAKMGEDQLPLATIQTNTTLKNNMLRAILAHTSKKNKKRRNTTKALLFSVCFLFLGLASVYYYNYYPTIDTYTATYSSRTITLADQSTITLLPGATLSVSQDFNTKNRDIQFKGHAFFDIARNPQLPFTISGTQVKTSVLGTSFWIKEEETQTVIEVETGQVKVEDPLNQIYVLLQPKEKAEYKNKQLQKYNADQEHISSWRSSLQMVNASFAHWKASIEQEFDIIILSKHSNIQQIKITGDYRNSSLTDILDSFCFINNLVYHNQNHLITINEAKTHD
ncbi:FecR family protein [Myroides sp. C15-4]|uniref:FecR family protein n=1 Tax=Myroides sp. C15-4 TaxID=3400532 RepID=UPI003D2F7E9E